MIVSTVQKQPKRNNVAAPQASTSQDRIRERAFEIYERRGSKPGHDLQDWFRAERQILAR